MEACHHLRREQDSFFQSGLFRAMHMMTKKQAEIYLWMDLTEVEALVRYEHSIGLICHIVSI